MNLFIICKLYTWLRDLNIDFMVGECLFGALKLTMNADHDTVRIGFLTPYFMNFPSILPPPPFFNFVQTLASNLHPTALFVTLFLLGGCATLDVLFCLMIYIMDQHILSLVL